MKIIAVLNTKGGVGKTTSVINIGAGLSKLGKKVLLLDLDPQAQLTYGLGIQAHELETSLLDVLKKKKKLGLVLKIVGDLALVPSSLALSSADQAFSSLPGRERLLDDALKGIKGYKDFDYLLIDCPAYLGLLVLNALVVSREVFIPVQTEYLALHGLRQTIEFIEVAQKRFNDKLKAPRVIGTCYNSQISHHRDVLKLMRTHYDENLFDVIIREDIAFSEAASFGLTIFDYKPQGQGAEDYLNLCRDITLVPNKI